MIKKLKIKFIVLGTSVLFALLAAIVFAMNLVNYRSMINEADGIISLISENNGAFPDNFQPSNMVSITDSQLKLHMNPDSFLLHLIKTAI